MDVKSKILIIGGTGNIGKYLVEASAKWMTVLTACLMIWIPSWPQLNSGQCKTNHILLVSLVLA
ncbi:unnamed protein product [Coffea canephora]|uniref:DH200=94 genomic scaffold, scaffold_1518 n=1 Tax=Coffea canephora TaxID=49390 RepID=A0A068VJD9_COFCA|nr:unnamed protein product [Coffea canephora]